MGARAGYGGRTTFSNAAGTLYDQSFMANKEWSTDDKQEDQDTTNFESLGFDEGVRGVIGCDWSVKGDWRSELNAFSSPPGLYPRDDLPKVKLLLNQSDNVFWKFPVSRVLSAKNTCPVRGTVTFEADCKSNGIFYNPAGG